MIAQALDASDFVSNASRGDRELDILDALADTCISNVSPRRLALKQLRLLC